MVMKMCEDDEGYPEVPIEVLESIIDLENGDTATKEEIIDALTDDEDDS